MIDNYQLGYSVAVVSVETVQCVRAVDIRITVRVYRAKTDSRQVTISNAVTLSVVCNSHCQVCESLQSGDRLSIGHHFKGHHV